MEKLIWYKGIKILIITLLNTGSITENVPIEPNKDGSIYLVNSFRYISTNTIRVFKNDTLVFQGFNIKTDNLLNVIDHEENKLKRTIDNYREPTLEEKLLEKGFKKQ